MFVFDRGFEQRPLKPRRVAQVTGATRIPSSATRRALSPRKPSASPNPSRRCCRRPERGRDRAAGRRARSCSMSASFARPRGYGIQTARVDIARRQHGDDEVEFVVGRVAGRFPAHQNSARWRVRRSRARQTAVRVRQERHRSPRCGPAAKRCCRKARQSWKPLPDVLQGVADKGCAVGAKVGGNAAGNDPYPSSADGRKRASAARNTCSRRMAQCACIRRERGVVADGADVAEMVRQPFELRHQRPEILARARRLELQRRLDRVGEGEPHKRRWSPEVRAQPRRFSIVAPASTIRSPCARSRGAVRAERTVSAAGGESGNARLEMPACTGPTGSSDCRLSPSPWQKRVGRSAAGGRMLRLADAARPKSRDRAKGACRALRPAPPIEAVEGRSSRRRADCSGADRGNVPAGHARLTTAISAGWSSITAICTMGAGCIAIAEKRCVAGGDLARHMTPGIRPSRR